MVSVFAVTAFAADCKVNDSDISAEYVGGCVNGLAHGRGKAKGSDTYEGEFKQGNKHGKGTYLWASGNKYVGGWQNDKQAGLGVAEFTNGSRYEGEFKNGEANGFGAFTIPRKAIDIAKHTNKGQWIGENYIEKGLFKDTNFILGCNNNTDCKQEQANREAQERRDQAARDEQYRRDAPARQGRQMCEAQKQTCRAHCPAYRSCPGFCNDARDSCMFSCDRIQCN